MNRTDNGFRQEATKLEAHLHDHGFIFESLNDWISGRTPSSAERPLIAWLERTSSDEIRDLIARILTQKGFVSALEPLMRAFRASGNDSTRWAIGNAISHIGFTKAHWHDILGLAADPRFGRGRQMIVDVLHRIKLPETEAVLVSLLDDRDVDAFALRALSYCGSYSAYERLRQMSVEERSPLFRQTLTTAIPRLERKLKHRPN